MSGRRPGRPGGGGTTRNDVLAAARYLFAERGYRDTTVRAIAAEAGVTPAMVRHFFGGKQQLFLAAVRMPIDPVQVLTALAEGPQAGFPERLVTAFVEFWSDQATGPALRSMMRGALTEPDQLAAFRGFGEAMVVPAIAEGLAVPPERAAAALATMLGMAMLRHVVAIPALADLTGDQVVRTFAPAVAAILFGPAAPGG